MLILCNGLIPQLMWAPKLRRNIPVVYFVCLAVTLGMWLERFVIIPMSLMTTSSKGCACCGPTPISRGCPTAT